MHSGYTFFCQYMCSLGIEPTTFALQTQCSTTEPQDYYWLMLFVCSGSWRWGGTRQSGTPGSGEWLPPGTGAGLWRKWLQDRGFWEGLGSVIWNMNYFKLVYNYFAALFHTSAKRLWIDIMSIGFINKMTHFLSCCRIAVIQIHFTN